MDEPCDLIARTLTGLEEVLASELQALGATDISAQRRVVHFRGDRRVLYAANLWCRTATRVLKPIHTFSATTDDDLYRSVQQLDWSEHLSPRDTLAINPLVSGELHTHSLYAAQRTKDAIVDQLRERHGQRPSVDLDNPTLRIGLHLRQSQGTIYLDASGRSLHRRGYRTAAGEAPLSEVLAAGILMLGGWDSSKPLVDFMCGSGTIPIEAALLARRIAPGLIRNDFGYMRWRGYDRALHERLVQEAREVALPACASTIQGSDIDASVLELARHNARRAGVAADIVFDVTNYSDVQPPREPGWLVCNPPYDQRLKMAHVENLYRRLGRVLKHTWPGHQALLLSGNLDAAVQIGLRPARRFRVFNGPIECRLLRFALYDGRRSDRDATEPVAEPTPPTESSPVVKLRSTADQGTELASRLTRMGKHWAKWARRQQVDAYRIYDQDIPEIPLTIDFFAGHLVIAEHERPHHRSDIEHRQWLEQMSRVATESLNIPRDRVWLRPLQSATPSRVATRSRTPLAADRDELRVVVRERALQFEVRCRRGTDPGLPLHARTLRQQIETQSAGRRVLILFGHTGAYSVAAAVGGAAQTVTVEAADNNVNWIERNLALNHVDPRSHRVVEADPVQFASDSAKESFDLIVVAPPSALGPATARRWDVLRDHGALLQSTLPLLAADGQMYFVTTARRLKLAEGQLPDATLREITAQTVPSDHRNRRAHRCWSIRRRRD